MLFLPNAYLHLLGTLAPGIRLDRRGDHCNREWTRHYLVVRLSNLYF